MRTLLIPSLIVAFLDAGQTLPAQTAYTITSFAATYPGQTVENLTEVGGINGSGDVAGTLRWNGNYYALGYVRGPNGTIHYFTPQTEGPYFTYGLGISDIGTIVGQWPTGAYIRLASGATTNFVVGADATDIYSINVGGSFAGVYFGGPYGSPQGFMATPSGSITPLQYSTVEPFCTYATGINNFNTVVGYFQGSNGAYHGFLLPAGGQMVQIDVPGAIETQAFGLNDLGQVVGFASGPNEGFVYSNGQYTLVAVPGAISTSLSGINNRGELAGTYIIGNTQNGFVASPTP